MFRKSLSKAFLLGGLALVLSVPVASGGSDTDSTTERCTKHTARAAFVAFLDAFNRGDLEELDALFAQEPDFRWYASGPPGRRIGAAATHRATLIGYFRNRHAAGDRMALVSFGFNASPRWGNFEYTVRRRSPRFKDGRWFRTSGKGAILCGEESDEIFVLTFASPSRQPPNS